MENQQSANEILNEYGYENWTSLADGNEYAIDKQKVARSAAAIRDKKEKDLARDLAALAIMQDKNNLPMKPPKCANVQ